MLTLTFSLSTLLIFLLASSKAIAQTPDPPPATPPATPVPSAQTPRLQKCDAQLCYNNCPEDPARLNTDNQRNINCEAAGKLSTTTEKETPTATTTTRTRSQSASGTVGSKETGTGDDETAEEEGTSGADGARATNNAAAGMRVMGSGMVGGVLGWWVVWESL
ncbi:hypothetical protein AJ80_04246 [Polytolypa hystricis UAMH7299]|uniref:Uncharacterized protein n=1 Tax=Polytolypa hystricis (strain UAMH7299) TaxID=1447883 RepID=A0A2B7YCA5_POLH7|nr:hypothetical protein AJ80_04246 [Polytolypa hystricis UAMH7299]